MLHPAPLIVPGLPLPVSRVCFGTVPLGTSRNLTESTRLLESYIEHGGTLIDTAHMYANWLPDGEGASEITLGKWLKHRGHHQDVMIATKGGATSPLGKRVRQDILRDELVLSLERLGLDSVELYWLHRDDPEVPVGDILGWLEEFRAEGLIGAYGASNWTHHRLAAAQLIAHEENLPGFVGSQVGWSLARLVTVPNEPVDDTVRLDHDTGGTAWHAHTRLPVFAYEAQAQGFFSGNYHADLPATIPRQQKVRLRYDAPDNWARLATLQRWSQRLGVSANQLALAWLWSRDFPVCAIIGPGTVAQLQDTMNATKIEWPEALGTELEHITTG